MARIVLVSLSVADSFFFVKAHVLGSAVFLLRRSVSCAVKAHVIDSVLPLYLLPVNTAKASVFSPVHVWFDCQI